MSYVDAHTHKLDQSPSLVSLSLANVPKPLPLRFSIGIHPWAVTRESNIKELEGYARHENCLAIGETGLDRSPRYISTFNQQIKLFEQHIELAQTLNKPLVIHSVKTYSDIIEKLSKSQFSNPILFHDFNGNKEIIEQLLKFDSYFSYGDKLFRPDSKGHKNINSIPKERILLETDDSDRNITEVYQQAFEVLGIELEQLKTIVATNFRKFINLD